MKTKEKLTEYKSMSADALKAKVSSLQEELMNLRFRHASGQLEQTAQLRNLRKDIARIKTTLNSMEAR